MKTYNTIITLYQKEHLSFRGKISEKEVGEGVNL